jgi:regulator of extracellular matrix RemA (YlzA/DUF370 family)
MSGDAGLAERIQSAIADRSAPPAARLAAARGALPLEPSELAPIQVLLLDDEDEEVRAAARDSLDALPADAAFELAGRGDAPQALLDHFASGAREDVLAVLAENQVGIRRHPELGKRLLDNPALPDASRSRLLDYLAEVDKEARQAAAAAEQQQQEAQAAQAAAEEEELPPARDPFLASLGIDAEVEAMLPELDLDIGQLAERSELLGDPDDSDDESSLLNALAKMNVGQKLRRALFGTREERAVLVRDSNRIVASAVVKNPKFTEQEAERVSNSKNVSDEVLRLIGRHRDFAKSYAIQHNLVRNPRTPVDLSMHFIPRLNDRDLKMLVKNRNVSDGVRRQAKKIITTRESRRRVRVKR